MLYVSEIRRTAPAEYKTELQQKTYEALERLQIPYERVETDEAISMTDCVRINEALDMKMVKTLFLCNQRQTEFYLFVTRGDKRFQAKTFCAALGISRVSFAPAEAMQRILGTAIGAATVFSALLPSARQVHFVFDRDVAGEPWYGCSDGTTTGYLKLETRHVLHTLLPAAGHAAQLVEL